MTAEDATNDLLSLIGVDSQEIAGDATVTRIASDINATLQLLWSKIPQWWNTVTVGEILRSPVTITVQVTSGSKTFTATGYQSWMEGCTVTVGGIANRIAASGTLLYPWVGGTGETSITVYQDFVKVGETHLTVIQPVFLLGYHPLHSLPGVIRHEMGGDILEIGEPTSYAVEVSGRYASGASQRGIRVFPLPQTQYTLSYEVRPSITRIVKPLDSTKVIPVPFDYAESVFMPLLRKQFATWKHFNAQGMKTILDEQVMQAWDIIRELAPQPTKRSPVGVPKGW